MDTVSSRYRIICLSHDPAIVIPDLEWANPQGMECALAHIKSRDFAATLGLHRTCELIGGRYSHHLAEVYCPPSCEDNDGWIDVTWLRLLSAIHTSTGVGWPSSVITAVNRIDRRWSKGRLRRLRVELLTDEWWTP